MEKNLSEMDSGARIIIGIILAVIYTGYAGIPLSYPLNWALLALAVVMLVTGILGFCPIYKALGMSTVEKPAKKKV